MIYSTALKEGLTLEEFESMKLSYADSLGYAVFGYALAEVQLEQFKQSLLGIVEREFEKQMRGK